MSWFDFLKRPQKKRASPPIRTIRPPGVVRQEREAREADEAAAIAPVAEKKADFFDTGSLEMARDPGDGDNPYDTQSWQVDSPQGPRRVDDLKAVNKERVSGEEDNPYDTIVTRKGW